MKWLYECFGVSKQAFYKRLKVDALKQDQIKTVLELIRPIRYLMPRYGTEKLHLDIREELASHNIKMGRDAFMRFCRTNKLLVPKTKRYFVTTDSNHSFHKPPNLIKNLEITHSEQVFVTDMTYIKLEDKHAYLALVTDLYSKKIMGYKLDDNMKVGLVKDALSMSIKNCEYAHQEIIHHSDRGIQYCFPEYTEFARKNGFILSTTEKYDPYENAVAERINQTLKYEFGLRQTLPNLEVAQKMLRQAVLLYNNQRKHRSLEMNTPSFAHINQIHTYKTYQSRRKFKKETVHESS
jgi:transposase InsO family protein